MEQDIDRLLQLAEDNNKMLHKLVGDLRWRRFVSLFKWTLIIGVALGLFYYLEPYIDKTIQIYQAIYGVTGNGGSSLNVTDLVDKIMPR